MLKNICDAAEFYGFLHIKKTAIFGNIAVWPFANSVSWGQHLSSS